MIQYLLLTTSCVRIMNLSLREMTAFRRVLELGSVTAAAADLHVTQPAVSRMLQGIETRLGFALFRRHRKRLFATAEALAFYPQVVEAFAALEAVEQRASDLKLGHAGSVRIAAIAAFADTVVPDAIAHFRRRHPAVSLSVRSTTAVDAADLVAGNRADIGLIIGPSVAGGVVSRDLCATRIGCVVPKGHRFATRRSLSIRDLKDEPVIVLASTLPLGSLVAQTFAAMNVPLRRAITVNQSRIACALVARGAGVALLDGTGFLTGDPAAGLEMVPLRPELPIRGRLLVADGPAPSRYLLDFIAALDGAVARMAARAGRLMTAPSAEAQAPDAR